LFAGHAGFRSFVHRTIWRTLSTPVSLANWRAFAYMGRSPCGPKILE
jgi:hypothetical protein